MKAIIQIIQFSVILVLPMAAQDIEIPLTKIIENPEVNRLIQKNSLISAFIEKHQSDTIGVEFNTTEGDGGVEWANYTNVNLIGNDGEESETSFSTHHVFRVFPFGPDHDDDWHDYLYVIRVVSDDKSALAVIHFRCQFAFPEKVNDGTPELKELEVISDRSVIK